MQKITIRNILAIVFAFAVFIFSLFLGGGAGVSYAATVSTDVQSAFESRNVLDDLDGSTIGGEEFSLDTFGWDKSKNTQVISFVEYCYSYYTSKMDDYALYVYVYNPQCVDYVYDSVLNEITLACTYDKEDETVQYYSYSLTYLNMSVKAGYEGLFFKYKVELDATSKERILNSVKAASRVYKIGEIELLINGETNAQSYAVGSTYTYSGFAEGYGNNYATSDTLSCTVDNFSEVLSLDVHSTYYRPEGSNGSADTQDTLHSVYFSVPNEVIEEYGAMSAVHATWLNALTNPILVTGNETIYNAVLPFIATTVDGGNFHYASDDNSPLKYAFIAGDYNESASWNHASHGSAHISYNDNGYFTASAKRITDLQYLFLASDYDADSYTLPAETLLGNKADGQKGYFETYTEKYGGNLVNGKYSQSLFESVADSFTDITLSADETFTLTDEVISQSLWQKIVGGGYIVTNTNTYTLSAIKEVGNSDFKSTALETCEGLYIDESDYTEFKSFYDSATKNNETVYLFRYYQSDYTCYEAIEYERGEGDWTVLGTEFDYDYVDTNAYFAQMWVQLDFDIIDLTFTKDNVSTVIPVAMSPMDLAVDATPPIVLTSDDDPDWLKLLKLILALLAAILIFVLLYPIIIPILKVIFKGIWWFISFPFKLIAKLFKKDEDE